MFEGTTIDTALHLVTFAVAVILLAVSVKAYRKRSNSKFLYICLAFGFFALKEGLTTAGIFGLTFQGFTWIIHSLNLVILGLFFRGTVK